MVKQTRQGLSTVQPRGEKQRGRVAWQHTGVRLDWISWDL